MFDKYIYNFLMFVNHWSTKLHHGHGVCYTRIGKKVMETS